MVEPNDRIGKEVPTRNRRRKSAGWKSGLMLSGLGAVVLGAGYLAGVNAPAVAQSSTLQAAGQDSPPQAVAQNGATGATREGNVFRSPESNRSSESNRVTETESESDDRLFLGYDENGNAVYLNRDGSLELGSNNGSGSQNQALPQLGGLRSRQSGGFSQQQPNFSRPMTRSRGS